MPRSEPHETHQAGNSEGSHAHAKSHAGARGTRRRRKRAAAVHQPAHTAAHAADIMPPGAKAAARSVSQGAQQAGRQALRTQDAMSEIGDNFLSPLISMQRQINSFMEDAFRNFSVAPSMWPLEHDRVMPKVKVWEDEKYFHLQTRLPRNEPENVRVSVHDGYMTIRWNERSEETRYSDTGAMHASSSQVSHRTVMLPQNADPAGAEAIVKDGTLEILMPKHAEIEDESRDIPVKRIGSP